MKKYLLAVSAFALVSTVLISCNNDDDKDMPTPTISSVISFENVLESKESLKAGTFAGMGNAEVNAPVVLPGQSINFTFHAGKGQTLMFAINVWLHLKIGSSHLRIPALYFIIMKVNL